MWVKLKLYETLWERIAVDNWPASVVEQSSFERLMSVLKHWYCFLSENLFSDTLISVIFFKYM